MSVPRGKAAAFLAALPVLAVIVVSCTGKKPAKREILFWQFWDASVIAPMVEDFEAKNPDVRVKVEQLTWKSGLEKIQAAIASGTQPDLCEIGSTWLPRFSYEGVLEDLTSVYHDLADSFLMWESAKWKGRVYGLPWVQGSRVLFYNQDLFFRAGLDPERPPESWDEIIEAAQRIDALGEDIRGFGLNLGERYVLYKKFMAFAWGNGGRILGDDGSTVLFNSPENLETLKFYLALAEHSLMEKQEVLDHYFKSGKLGMQISGAWNLKNYALEAPELRYGVALVPKPSRGWGYHSSFAGTEMLVVFRDAKAKKEALELARFLQEYPRARSLSLAVGSVFPAAKRALNDPTFTGDKRLSVFIRQSFTSRSAPPHPAWVEMEEAINRAIEEVLYRRLSPQEALERAEGEIKEAVERFE